MLLLVCISVHIRREFENPATEPGGTLDCVGRLRHAIEKSLKNTGRVKVTIFFPVLVYNYLFKGKGTAAPKSGWKLLQMNDFPSVHFPSWWDVLMDENGEGLEICYLVAMRSFLNKSPLNFHRSHTDREKFTKSMYHHYEPKISMEFCKTAAKLRGE